MVDVHHQKKEGSVILNHMQFEVKPIAVRSKNLEISMKALYADSLLYLDRGLHLLINRFQLYNASGNFLKDIQNYHILYGLIKTCTGNSSHSDTKSSTVKNLDPAYGGAKST